MKYAIILIILGHIFNQAHAAPLPTPATCAIEKPAGKWSTGVDYWKRTADGKVWQIANNPTAGWGVRRIDTFQQGWVWTYGPGHQRIGTAAMQNCDVVRLLNDFRARIGAGNYSGIRTIPVGIP